MMTLGVGGGWKASARRLGIYKMMGDAGAGHGVVVDRCQSGAEMSNGQKNLEREKSIGKMRSGVGWRFFLE